MSHNENSRPVLAGVYERCRGIGFLYGEEPHFARSYHQTLRRKFLNFRNMIGLWKASNYLLSQVGSADETPFCFDMPASCTVADVVSEEHQAMKRCK
jgi:hypothetical protein